MHRIDGPSATVDGKFTGVALQVGFQPLSSLTVGLTPYKKN